jgi:hypothetical protein
VSPHHRKPPRRFPGSVEAVRQTLARRRAGTDRIRLRTGTGQPRRLDADDASAEALFEAAEALISASQRASERT